MDVVDRAELDRIRARKEASAAGRREIVKLAGDAIAASKRAIFAMHRSDFGRADELLAEADAAFAKIRDRVAAAPALVQVGAYRAALEEFIEASLYRAYVRDGSIGAFAYPEADDDVFLGGLCDLAGELQRRQVALATSGDRQGVADIAATISGIVEALLDMDLEGSLRVKADQAKNALRRAEDVLYDVSIRHSRA